MSQPADWGVLLTGPMGVGKTRALRTVSDEGIVKTPLVATDNASTDPARDAVSMGVLRVSAQTQLKLYSAPGLDRLGLTWDRLLQQVHGVVLLLNHGNGQGRTDLDHFAAAIRERSHGRELPMVIGVTHMDVNPRVPLSIYADHILVRRILACGVAPPVFAVDTRERQQVQGLLLALMAQLEMSSRYPKVSALAKKP